MPPKAAGEAKEVRCRELSQQGTNITKSIKRLDYHRNTNTPLSSCVWGRGKHHARLRLPLFVVRKSIDRQTLG